MEKNLIVSKMDKMDKNNQYGNTMTKPLPYGCIKIKNNTKLKKV